MGIILNEGNKWLGSYADFKNFIIGKIITALETHERLKTYNFAHVDLPEYNITVALGEENNIVMCMYDNAQGWYGLCELDNPFDNIHSTERQSVSDMYGGSYFDCLNLVIDDYDRKDLPSAIGVCLGIKT